MYEFINNNIFRCEIINIISYIIINEVRYKKIYYE